MKPRQFRELCGVCDQLGLVIRIQKVAKKQFNLIINGEIITPRGKQSSSFVTLKAARRKAIRTAIPVLQLTPTKILQKLTKTNFSELWKRDKTKPITLRY